LLFLDHWPLNRIDLLLFEYRKSETALAMLREKLPWFGLSLASCVVTVFAQSGSIQPVSHISFLPRVANTALSYLDYLRQMFWPPTWPLYPWDPSRLNLSWSPSPFSSCLL
jgi:hypothetical protein